MNRKIFFYLSFVLVFVACKSDPKNEAILTIDSLAIEATTKIDSAIVADSASYTSEKKEQSANMKVIEKKYGEQWDFCDCVRKNDSINKVIESASDDADYDKIFARMDVIDQHCKTLLIQPNSTPEERAKYEKRVRDCLRK